MRETMLKTAIIYASQNGSTKKIAERINTALTKEGADVSLFNIHQKEDINIDNYDLIGIGCPTYISRPSYAIMDILDKLANLENKKVFTFVTYGSEIGDGSNLLRNKIRKMRGIDVGYLTSTGKHLFPGYTKNGYLFSPKDPTNEGLEKIDTFVKDLLLNIKNNTHQKAFSSDPKPSFIFRFERFVTNRFFIKHLYSHYFSLNKALCISCDSCVKNCPMNNIFKDKDGHKKWGRNCIFCLKCEISCVDQAISSPISWSIFKPFLKYNIYKAVKMKIPYLRK
jgi:flavodoxin/NAD-dependent dihydropyrimidine dehydrogenase PreA subunit